MADNTNPNVTEVTPPATPAPKPQDIADDDIFDPEDFKDTQGQNDDLDDDDEGEGNKQSAPVPGKLKVKYNGEDKELSLDEAVVLAQKGLNYDKKVQELETIKNSEEIKTLAELAKLNGHSDVKEYVKALRENAEKAQIDKRINELVNQGYDPKKAEYVAKLELKNNTTAPASQTPPDTAQTAEAEFQALMDAFPETRNIPSLDAYPQEFKDLIAQGVKPVTAYAQYLKAQLEAQQKALAQYESNKQRDPGSLGTGKGDGKKDEFLAGLLGE